LQDKSTFIKLKKLNYHFSSDYMLANSSMNLFLANTLEQTAIFGFFFFHLGGQGLWGVEMQTILVNTENIFLFETGVGGGGGGNDC
jgi:hypothetical protein